MKQIAKYILCCFLLVMSIQVSSFAQTALDNPFAVFHGVKPKGKVDSVLVYRYPYEGAQTYLYIYDKKRRLIKINLYRYLVNPDFGTTHRDTAEIIYTYNKNGKLLTSYSPRNLKAVRIYKYISTKTGYNIRTNYYDSTKVYEMRFNKVGQMMQSGPYKRNDLKQNAYGDYDYLYDKKGNLIRQTEYFDKFIPTTTIYKYDSDGNEIDSHRSGQGYPRATTYKYSNYDKNHNWTQQAVDFVNGNDVDESIHHQDTIRRRITYYK